jgi:hypothetical protein
MGIDNIRKAGFPSLNLALQDFDISQSLITGVSGIPLKEATTNTPRYPAAAARPLAQTAAQAKRDRPQSANNKPVQGRPPSITLLTVQWCKKYFSSGNILFFGPACYCRTQ